MASPRRCCCGGLSCSDHSLLIKQVLITKGINLFMYLAPLVSDQLVWSVQMQTPAFEISLLLSSNGMGIVILGGKYPRLVSILKNK